MVPSRLDLDHDWEVQLKQMIQDNLQPILLDTKLAYEQALHRIPISSSRRRQGLTIQYETVVKELRRNAEEQFARERERGRKARGQMAVPQESHRGQVISDVKSKKNWGAVFEEQQAILQAIQQSKLESSPAASPDLVIPSPGPSTPTSVQGPEGALIDQVFIQSPASPISHPFAPESQITAEHTTEVIQYIKTMSVSTSSSLQPALPVELKKRKFEEQQEKFRQRELEIKRKIERKKLQDQLNWKESAQPSLSSGSSSSGSSASSSSSATSSVASSPVLSGFPLIYAHSKPHMPARKASNPLPAPPSPISNNSGRRPSIDTSSSSAAALSHTSKPITITSRAPGANPKAQDSFPDFTPPSYYHDPAFSATPSASSPHLAPSFPSYQLTVLTPPNSVVAISPRDTNKLNEVQRSQAIYSQHEQQWRRIAAYHELLWSDFPWPVLAERTSPGLPPSAASATHPRQISPGSPPIASSKFSGPWHSQYIQPQHNHPSNHSRNHSSHYQHGQQYHYNIQHQHSSYHHSSSALFSHPVTPPHSAALSSPYSNIPLYGNSVITSSAGKSVTMVKTRGDTPPTSPNVITSLPLCPRDLNFQDVRAYMLSSYYPTPGITDSQLAPVMGVNQDTNNSHALNTTLVSPSEVKEERLRQVQIQKDRLKVQIRTWHPDRFQAKFLRKIRDEREREMVREGVQILVRWLSEILKEVEAKLRDD